MRYKRQQVMIFLILSALFLLCACDDKRHLRDLQKFINDLQSAQKAEKDHGRLVVEEPIPVIFDTTIARSPFTMGESTDLSTAPHPLQAYSTNMLRFKGTMHEDGHAWAYVSTPDNALYSVKIGDAIGDHYGKIINIYSDRIEVEEKVLDDPKHPTQRIVTLQLKDGS